MEATRGKASVVLAVLGALVVAGLAAPAAAEVSLSINIGPPVVVAEPPEMVVVPETRVYFVPDGDVDLFFYGGYWWSPRGPRWYRARAYNGPWVGVERRIVPGPVVRLPGNYRSVYTRGDHVPYGQWKKHHKEWDKQRHREVREHRKVQKGHAKEYRKEQREHGKEHRGGGRGRD